MHFCLTRRQAFQKARELRDAAFAVVTGKLIIPPGIGLLEAATTFTEKALLILEEQKILLN